MSNIEPNLWPPLKKVGNTIVPRRAADYVDVAGQGGVILVKQDEDKSTRYATITEACAAAGDLDVIYVGPGDYDESFTLPGFVTLIGAGQDSTYIGPDDADDHVVTMGLASRLVECVVRVPTVGSDHAAILVEDVGATSNFAYFQNVATFGASGAQNNYGVQILSGAYASFTDCKHFGGAKTILKIDDSYVDLANYAIEPSATAIGQGVSAENGSTVIAYGFKVNSPNAYTMTDVIYNDDSIVRVTGTMIDGSTNAINIAGADSETAIMGGLIANQSGNSVIATEVTAATTLHLIGVDMDATTIDTPGTGAWTDGDVTWSLTNGDTVTFGGPVVGTTFTGDVTGDLTGNADTVTGFTPAGGSMTLSGADAVTLTTTAVTNVTLPTTGTLLANLSEDTTPALGGPLELGGNLVYGSEFDNGNSGAADTIDFATNGNYHLSTLTDNVTYTFTAPTGPAHLTLKMVQDAGGTNTVTFPATVLWDSGTEPTWVTTGDAINLAFFYYSDGVYYGSGIVGAA